MRVIAAAFAAFGMLASPAFATLGAAPSAPADAEIQQVGAASRVTYRLASGTTVTEYETPQGVVFAVGWTGPVMPDMQALLGANFNRFVQSQRGRGTSPHTSLRLSASDLQVVSSGHPGAMRGAAWLPALVPAGFDVGALL